jgi:hypothetical protein
MGLESHIRRVIEDEPASGLHFGFDYWFENGLTCKDALTAEKVMELLDESNQFAATMAAEEGMAHGEVKIVFKSILRRVE